MTCRWKEWGGRAAVLAVALTPGVGPARSQSAQFETWKEPLAGRAPKLPCAHLRALTTYDFAIDTAAVVPAQGGAPEFCLVEGLILPEVRFQAALPSEWNGRLYMFGNGGFAGEPINAPDRTARRDRALRNGFAVASTNTGHDAAREPLASFAASPQKLVDYAYRAVHLTAVTAKTLSRTYYDARPARSYFDGCSTGGRQGLISAQRFPDDFDGIVVGAPVLDFTGTMVHYAAMNRAFATASLSVDRLRLLAEKVYAKCDAADGLADGLLDDPRRCGFDPRSDVPACQSDGDEGACLTPAQVKALQAVYGDVLSNGARIFPGLPVGGEVFVPTASGRRSGWHPWIVREGQGQTQTPVSFLFMEAFFKDMATPGTPIDWRTFDPDRDMAKLAGISALLDAKDPDLERYRARGGKILMYFGWADPALNPLMGLGYFEAVREKMGAGTSDFFRLFMMPGVFHCSGGPGPSLVDTMTPLVEWVERGVRPDRLVAARREEGRTLRTRPLCPYPSVAKHNGRGSVDDAASFMCEMPQSGTTSGR